MEVLVVVSSGIILTAESIQHEPTGCTVYFEFISVINLYVFRAGLLLIIRSTTLYIQGVTGGTDQTSGECSLGQTIPI